MPAEAVKIRHLRQLFQKIQISPLHRLIPADIEFRIHKHHQLHAVLYAQFLNLRDIRKRLPAVPGKIVRPFLLRQTLRCQLRIQIVIARRIQPLMKGRLFPRIGADRLQRLQRHGSVQIIQQEQKLRLVGPERASDQLIVMNRRVYKTAYVVNAQIDPAHLHAGIQKSPQIFIAFCRKPFRIIHIITRIAYFGSIHGAYPGITKNERVVFFRMMKYVLRLHIVFIRLHAVVPDAAPVKYIVRVDRYGHPTHKCHTQQAQQTQFGSQLLFHPCPSISVVAANTGTALKI